MGEFLGRPLVELDALYRIPGSPVRTNTIDLTGVTLVHDVRTGAAQSASRQLTGRLAQQLGQETRNGIAYYDQGVTAAGAGFERVTAAPWTNITAAGIDPDTVDCWVVDFGGVTSAATVDGMYSWVVRDSQRPANGEPLVMLGQAYSDAAGRPAITPAPVIAANYYGALFTRGAPLPIQLFRSAQGADYLAGLASHTGAGTTRFSWSVVLTPKGIAPSWLI